MSNNSLQDEDEETEFLAQAIQEPKKQVHPEGGRNDTPGVKLVFGDPAEEWMQEPTLTPAMELEDLEWITRPDVHMANKLNDYNYDQKQIDELVNKPVREEAMKQQSWQTARVTSENYWSQRNQILSQIAELESNPAYLANPTGRDIAKRNLQRQLAEIESEGRKIDSWYNDTRAPSQFPRYWGSRGEPGLDGDTNQEALNDGTTAITNDPAKGIPELLANTSKFIKAGTTDWSYSDFYNSIPEQYREQLEAIRKQGGQEMLMKDVNLARKGKQQNTGDAASRVMDANNFRKAVNDPNTEKAMIDAAVRGDARAFTDLAIQSGTNVARREGTPLDKLLGMVGLTQDKMATKSSMDNYLKTADQNFVKQAREAKAKADAEAEEKNKASKAKLQSYKVGDITTIQGVKMKVTSINPVTMEPVE